MVVKLDFASSSKLSSGMLASFCKLSIGSSWHTLVSKTIGYNPRYCFPLTIVVFTRENQIFVLASPADVCLHSLPALLLCPLPQSTYVDVASIAAMLSVCFSLLVCVPLPQFLSWSCLRPLLQVPVLFCLRFLSQVWPASSNAVFVFFLPAFPTVGSGSLEVKKSQGYEVTKSVQNMLSAEQRLNLEGVMRRMDAELHDYPGSGANNRHTPRPQLGRSCVEC
ncbi:Hypothetical predicted protein [Olea europaea subsp. europaea]|uniref:Uncharacterized protein n=1 Tax=Olea europaea subsp. europaea TaxID=158383 RepID=A0A8S0RWJ4_OLEEU|nr:Hypothetical predicted protein [Olea europaea subsp. europaea]